MGIKRLVSAFFIFSSLFWPFGNKSNNLPNYLKELKEQKDQFLTDLFNATLDAVIKLSTSFDFVNVSSDSINFFLYRRKSMTPDIVKRGRKSRIRLKKHIIYIIHGWGDSGTTPWIKNMIQAYQNQYKHLLYIAAVDWNEIAILSYFDAATAVQSIGNSTAEFIWEQIGGNKKKLKNIHIIGHSLGAHIAGFAGKRIFDISKNKIGRITALDAAAPLFEMPIPRTKSHRISDQDAEYVDCYHTNIGMKGQATSCGHVDVYFNCGGPFQPQCIIENKTILSYLSKACSCSHQSVHTYFTNTIADRNSYPLSHCKVKSRIIDINYFSTERVVYAGEFINRKARGRYCVSTKKKSTKDDERCILFYYKVI